MSRIPHGIPTISYSRLQGSTTTFGQGSDLISDGNAVIIHEPGQPSARFEVAQVIDKAISDEEACELTFGCRAGVGVGAALNPVNAFVNDSANVVVLLTGSKLTRKWQFLKRTFLPFIANEIIRTISERSQDMSVNMYKAQLTLSAFEIQDEIIGDLLRPGNRGLSIGTTLEEGVVVQGLHRETVVDEATLRKLLIDACDNRAVQTLPVGGSIDTSSGIFEFRLYQSDAGGGPSNPIASSIYQNRECFSRMVVVDLPSIDPLNVSSADEIRLFAGPTLNKSLLTFVDVVKKLNNPYRAQVAPFRAARLPHFLSELLGGNAVVVAMAHIAPGEPSVSKRTMEVLAALSSAMHYPMGARELSDTLRGLLGKYRAMLMHMQDEMMNQVNFTVEHLHSEQQIQKTVEKLQNELAQSLAEKVMAVEDRSRLYEMAELLKSKYNTILEEKLRQSSQLAEVEEDNIALAKTIVEVNLQMATMIEEHEKEKLEWNVQLLQKDTRISALEDEIKELVATIEKLTEDLNQKQQLLQGNNKEIAELHQQVEDRQSQLTEQKEKNIELGAELLTLVNRKDIMQQDYDKMKTEYDEMLRESNQRRNKEKELEDEVRKLLEKLLIKDEEVLEMRKLLMEANDSAAVAKIEAASSRRTAEDMQRLREELEMKKMQQEEDRRRYSSIADNLKEKISQEHDELRLSQQRIQELQRSLEEKTAVTERLVKEVDALKEHVKTEQEERKKLIEELETKIKEDDDRIKASAEAAAQVEAKSAELEPMKAESDNLEQKTHKSDAIRKALASMKMSNEEKKEKERQRKELELQSQVHRLEEDLKAEVNQSKELKEKLQKLQEKYRNILEASLLVSKPSDFGQISPKKASNQDHDDHDKGPLKVNVDFALKSLLTSFEDNEKSLMVKHATQSGLKNEILKSYRILCDHYKSSMKTIQEVLNVLQDPKMTMEERSMNSTNPLKKLVDNVLEEQYAFSIDVVQKAEHELQGLERNQR
jgi:hypothetical protein